jgi:hypothetical protein
MAPRIPISRFNSRVDSLLQGIADTVLLPADRDSAVREAVQKYNRDAPRRSAVDFAGDAGAYYLLYGKAVEVAESTRDAGIDLTSSGANQRLAIKFATVRTLTLWEFGFFLRRTGALIDAELIGELLTNVAGLPSAVIAEAERVPIDSDEGAPEGFDAKVRFRLANPVTLSAGTYHASLRSADYVYADGTTEVILGVKQSGSPTNDVSTYNGTVWSAFSPASAGILELIAGTPGWRSLQGRPLSVEYPAADLATDEAPNRLDDDEWEMYLAASGLWLRFPALRPATTETVRLNVAEPYEWTEGDVPLIETPVEHFEAISYLGASFCCDRLANKFGQKRSSTLSADVADRSRQGEFYRAQAKTYRAYYDEALGIGKSAKEMAASAAVLDIDVEPPHGSGFLFHERRTR